LDFPKSAAHPLERLRHSRIASQAIRGLLAQSKEGNSRKPMEFSGNWLVIVNPELFVRKICFRTTSLRSSAFFATSLKRKSRFIGKVATINPL
jgi:hypothetical protein